MESIPIGYNLGVETLSTEFKEYRVDKSYYYDRCKHAFRILNQIIDESVRYMFRKYLFRYISGFSNSDITGRIYFGVSDSGDVFGIPAVNREGLERMIEEELSLYFYNIYTHHYPRVKVTVIPVDYMDKTYYFEMDYTSFVKSVVNDNLQILERVREFREKKNRYLESVKNCRTKIVELTCDPSHREGIKEYIERNTDVDMDISLDQPVDENSIGVYKNDPTRLEYYLTRYRDHLQEESLRIKPKIDRYERPSDIYYMLFLHHHSMIDYLIKNYGYGLFLVRVDVLPSLTPITYKEGDYEMTPIREHDPVGSPRTIFQKSPLV